MDDDTFARYAEETLLASASQIEAARRVQSEKGGSLSDALVLSGALTADQRDEAIRALADVPQPGEILGPYRILDQIGAGGMGAVFGAEEISSGRRVALKVLPKAHTRDPGALRRFRQEAEAAFQLSHPHIVRGLAAGEDRGFAWFAMEHCEGESLDRRLRRQGPLPSREALTIASQIAGALHYAHGLGIIHRDIKPSNIVVTPEGAAKLLDLGLSKRLIDLEGSFRTETGATLGTPHYMAPEQAKGAKDADGRVDLYGLGATLFHLLTGRVPFPGATMVEIIAKHLDAPRPDPRSLRPDLPAGITPLVRRMMARRPEDRYRDGAELAADLELVASGKIPKAVPGKRRSRRLLWLAPVAAVAVASSFFLFPRPDPGVDLLALVDPARDSVGAIWKRDAGTLLSPDPATPPRIHVLELSAYPPPEYDLEVELERRGRTGSFDIGLVVDGHLCAVVFDGWNLDLSALTLIDGTPGPSNETALRKPALTAGRPHLVRCEVRKDAVKATVDGEVFVDWKGDSKRLTSDSAYGVRNPGQLFLAAWIPFRVSAVRLTPHGKPVDFLDRSVGSEAEWRNAVDLLARVDPWRHAVHGHWKREAEGIVSDHTVWAHLQLPYEPPEEYDFRIEFTRREGRDAVAQVCSQAGKIFSWEMGTWQDRATGFFGLVSHPSLAPPTFPSGLENGRRYVSLVQVRKDGCRALLDGRPIDTWKTDFSELKASVQWKPSSSRSLGIGSSDCSVVFHRAQLREVTGRGKFVDPEIWHPVRVSASGGGGGGAFEEIEGAPIVGMRYSRAGAAIRTIQAIYRKPDGSTFPGQVHGSVPIEAPREILARPGYAVAELQGTGTNLLRGFRLLFKRLEPSGLAVVPADRYESPWLGAPGQDRPWEPTSTAVAVGLHGRKGVEVDGLGLVLLKPKGRGPESPTPLWRSGSAALLGHWPLDEGQGESAQDFSLGDRPARLAGGTTWVEGKIGKALRFNRKGDCVQVPGFVLDSEGITIAAWVKHDSFEGDYQRYVTIGSELAVLREQFGGRLTFYVRVGSDLPGVIIPALTLGEWQHVAGTWDGRMLRIYRNGRLVGSRAVSGKPARGNGLEISSGSESMHGMIDDVRVYGRALTAADIAALAGLDPAQVPLRAPDAAQAGPTGVDYEYYEGDWTRLPDFDSLAPVAKGRSAALDLSPKKREEKFAFRFTGLLRIPKDGVYTFSLDSDDGSKLLIGDEEVFWNDFLHGGYETSGSIALRAGLHRITVLYFNGWGGCGLEASWEGPDLPKQRIPPEALLVRSP